jgi:hypothetical protein
VQRKIAPPAKRDLKPLEYHSLDAGHFALETNGDEVAKLMMRGLLGKHVAKTGRDVRHLNCRSAR